MSEYNKQLQVIKEKIENLTEKVDFIIDQLKCVYSLSLQDNAEKEASYSDYTDSDEEGSDR